MDLATLVRVLTWGLVTGSVYMLLATGITLIFGVMKVVNFAHGELMMIGAFITFILAHSAGLNPYLAIFVSMIAVGLVGVVIERFGFRLLRDGEKINEVFFSIALILILQNALWMRPRSTTSVSSSCATTLSSCSCWPGRSSPDSRWCSIERASGGTSARRARTASARC